MNKFYIPKNIILAFIIFMSIALKLSAQEDATSLIKSDNIFIEKDKKGENISKRDIQNKNILCYERNKKDIFKDYILPIIYLSFGAFLSWFASHISENLRKKSYSRALKVELDGNKHHLNNKFKKVFKEIPNKDLLKLNDQQILKVTNILKEDYYIHLSDFSWNQYKYVIGDYDKDNVRKIIEAYMLIGDINILVNASFFQGTDKTAPILLNTIVNARNSIET